MKKIIILTISLYQTIISIFLKNILGANRFCRFTPTCSDYAKLQIEKNGVLKGTVLTVKRVSGCHPFSKNI